MNPRIHGREWQRRRVYEGAVEAMKQWHLFFEPTVVGTVTGMVEDAAISFVLMYAFAWLYNAVAP